MPRQVILEAHSLRKDQASRIYSPRRGLPAEAQLGSGTCPIQPEHTAINAPQQPHPNVENRWGNLVIVIEAAEDETSFGQTRFRPRGSRPGYDSLRIID